jgi:LuxR family maltose regulon positive regulatory protein
MQGREDVTSFIAGFAGNDRYVFDYLVEEVLERQSDDVRSFLLGTCFLDRLSGQLCDAVTGRSGSKRTLDALYRANLFVVPLDDRREWYRYHHLFADVLISQLDADAREQLPLRHRRASDWYEQHGDRFEAIQHALAGECFERAAELIELAIPDMQRNRGEAVISGWLRMLPNELVRTRPVLGIGFVGALVSKGEFDGVEDRLRDVERGLAAIAEAGTRSRDTSAHGVVVVDENQLGRLPGAIELYRAALAQVRGDVPGTINHAQRVLELAPPDDHLGRAAGSGLLAIAYWSRGDLEAARISWTDCRSGLQRIRHIADALGASIALADIHLVQGHLREATQVYEQALQLATAQGGHVLRGTADMYAGLSELHRERNELHAAHQQLSKSQELGELAGLPQHPYRWRVAMAHLRRDEGDFDGAVALLDEAERLYVSDFFPHVRPVAAMRARVWISQGRLEEALRWKSDRGLGVGDELSYLREFEHITLARLLLAQNTIDDDAPGFLERLLEEAIHGSRTGSVIEISVLQALAHRGATEALIPLERALSLAEPEGYVRLFVEGGERIAALLKAALKRGIAPAYTRKLLAAFGPPETKAPAHPDLIEPLSDRELDVLRLLRSDLGGPEIARELRISINTMRTHTKNIFEKLAVNNRRSAVHRAEELNLLVRNQTR